LKAVRKFVLSQKQNDQSKFLSHKNSFIAQNIDKTVYHNSDEFASFLVVSVDDYKVNG